jgi:ferrous iron transport protein A
MEKNIKTIRGLKVNQKARVVEIRANGELGRRIRDMGLVPGVELTVIGRAPLRDPVAIRINDFTLTLRNNEADYVIVKIEE